MSYLLQNPPVPSSVFLLTLSKAKADPDTAFHPQSILTLTNSEETLRLPHHRVKLPNFLPSPKQLPSCTLVEMWSHFRPQSPWAQSTRAQRWNSSVGRAGLGAVQSAEFLYRSTLYCRPHCEQLGSAGPAASLTQLTDKRGDSQGRKSLRVQRLHKVRSAARLKEDTVYSYLS